MERKYSEYKSSKTGKARSGGIGPKEHVTGRWLYSRARRGTESNDTACQTDANGMRAGPVRRIAAATCGSIREQHVTQVEGGRTSGCCRGTKSADGRSRVSTSTERHTRCSRSGGKIRCHEQKPREDVHASERESPGRTWWAVRYSSSSSSAPEGGRPERGGAEIAIGRVTGQSPLDRHVVRSTGSQNLLLVFCGCDDLGLLSAHGAGDSYEERRGRKAPLPRRERGSRRGRGGALRPKSTSV